MKIILKHILLVFLYLVFIGFSTALIFLSAGLIVANWGSIIVSGFLIGLVGQKLLKERFTITAQKCYGVAFPIIRIGDFALRSGQFPTPLAIAVMLVLYSLLAYGCIRLGSRLITK